MGNNNFVYLVLCYYFLCCVAHPITEDSADHRFQQSLYTWEEQYYSGIPVDHFSYTDRRTFTLRYLLKDAYFTNDGPILLYAGNEGRIENYARRTGFMFDIAEEFGAAIVFAEHRFYGESLPFGNDSYSNVTNLGYLSSEQAIADFVQLILYLKKDRLPNAKNSSVIIIGGSYGGMLAAWARIKYPHIFDGAISSSAPLLWFLNAPERPGDAFYNIVTRTFGLSGCNLTTIMEAFSAIKSLSDDENGRKFLTENFRLDAKCPIRLKTDADQLISAVQIAMRELSMSDYPYETDETPNLPAWPVKAACERFSSKASGGQQELAIAAYQILDLFRNYTGNADPLCVVGSGINSNSPSLHTNFDPFTRPSLYLWKWQVCTELIMPRCSGGPPESIFPKDCPFNINEAIKSCKEVFGKIGYTEEIFRPDWVITNYGAQFRTASNIVFSNGYLDPWLAGAWRLEPAKEGTLISLIVDDGAHHYDLRRAHINDTESVKRVRLLEKDYIRSWILEAEQKRR